MCCRESSAITHPITWRDPKSSGSDQLARNRIVAMLRIFRHHLRNSITTPNGITSLRFAITHHRNHIFWSMDHFWSIWTKCRESSAITHHRNPNYCSGNLRNHPSFFAIIHQPSQSPITKQVQIHHHRAILLVNGPL